MNERFRSSTDNRAVDYLIEPFHHQDSAERSAFEDSLRYRQQSVVLGRFSTSTLEQLELVRERLAAFGPELVDEEMTIELPIGHVDSELLQRAIMPLIHQVDSVVHNPQLRLRYEGAPEPTEQLTRQAVAFIKLLENRLDHIEPNEDYEGCPNCLTVLDQTINEWDHLDTLLKNPLARVVAMRLQQLKKTLPLEVVSAREDDERYWDGSLVQRERLDTESWPPEAF